MSNPFTREKLVLALVIALLQACASGGARDRDPESGGDPLPVQEGVIVAPEVQGENARAFARATDALRSGRVTEAEGLLVQITEDQPELAGPWINLAEVYVVQGRESDARKALARAVAANPVSCAARTELGVLLRRQGEFAEAEAQYRACLDAAPDYRAAYLNLGILYELYLGRLEEALEAYRQYQFLAAEPDRRVAGWVMDLERRLGV